MLQPPLYIVYSREKSVYQSDPSISKLPSPVNVAPSAIKSINVLQGDAALKKYGAAAASGAIEIFLKNGRRYIRQVMILDTALNKSTGTYRRE